ncbi:hypothetical protein [Bdellovibrio sp. HCB337]|uniref:hypothetical protein n=1 Tax=Bdellovibrio sp. HCB337 TaxID=3394358 RepID=UPI0039A4CBFB
MTKQKNILLVLLATILGSSLCAHAQELDLGIESSTQTEAIYFYQNRYPLKNPYDKLVDNHGNGREDLYGVRNFRAVLNGVVYRGGANNVYNKYKKRANQNPLQNSALKNMCEEGFGTAVYLYSTNYNTAQKVTSCKSVINTKQTLNYVQATPHLKDSDARLVLNLIYKRLTSESDHGPIYLHCWNGWHASGLISAYTLRQFCDYTVDQAVSYWNRNTDGNNVGSNYDRLRAKIKSFQPDPNMKIAADLKAKICPQKL